MHAVMSVAFHTSLPMNSKYMYLTMQKIGFSPLGVAAKGGHMKTVEHLLDKGAKINFQDKVRNSNFVQVCSL